MKKILLFFLGLLVAVLLAEGLLRITGIYPAGKKFKVGRSLVLTPDSQVLPGTTSPVYYTKIDGIRGNTPKPEQSCRILAIGGSTTDCFFLDDSCTWPALLERKLNELSASDSFWVGNAGYDGAGTVDHLRELQEFYRKCEGLDAVIFLVGVNDFVRALMGNESIKEVKERGFLHNLRIKIKYLLWKTSSIYALTKAISLKQSTHLISISLASGGHYMINRQNRRMARGYLHDLPAGFQESLHIYEENLRQLIFLARELNLEAVFLTQPTAYDSNSKDYMKELFWFGWSSDGSLEADQYYYSIEVLREGMGLFNESLRKVCREKNVRLIDLEAIQEPDTTMFYDDCHLNNYGAEKVADFIAGRLLEY